MAQAAITAGIALITGGNKGIGFEIARQLGARGITTLIGARDEARGRGAAQTLRGEGTDAHFLQLDVTDQSMIDAVAASIGERSGRLDILVNNAGLLIDDAPPSALDLAILRRTYETNVFGLFAVTRAMLPLLRRSAAGRIVNISSSMGSLAQNSDPSAPYYAFNMAAYCSSKAAVNMLTTRFALELRDTPIKVNAADPGWVATDLGGAEAPRTVQQGAVAPVRLATLPSDGPTGGFFDEDGAVAW